MNIEENDFNESSDIAPSVINDVGLAQSERLVGKKDGNGNCDPVLNIKLPELNLDSEDESDDLDELQPIVFHPFAKNCEGSTVQDQKEGPTIIYENPLNAKCSPRAAKENTVSPHPIRRVEEATKGEEEVTKGEEEATRGVEKVRRGREEATVINALLANDDEIPILVKHDITELELDNALIRSSSQNSQPSKNIKEPPALGDSGSSRSSILEKLGRTMELLREENEQEKARIHRQVKFTNTAFTYQSGRDKSSEFTEVLDLRKLDNEVKVQVKNNCVLKRYGSASDDFSNTTPHTEGYTVKNRQQLKEESAAICRNKGQTQSIKKSDVRLDKKENNGKTPLMSKSISKHVRQNSKELKINKQFVNERVHDGSDKEGYEKMNRESCDMISAVDDMLANINDIIYDVSYPKEGDYTSLVLDDGDPRPLYDDTQDVDEVDEHVQSYTVFHEDESQTVYGETCEGRGVLGDALYGDSEHDEETADYGVRNMHNEFDSTVEVVEWSSCEMLEGEGKKISPVKTPRKDKNIFDSIFTHSFLSVKEIAHENTTGNNIVVNTKPRTDILGKKKSKNSSKTSSSVSPQKGVEIEKSIDHEVLETEDILKEKNDFVNEIRYSMKQEAFINNKSHETSDSLAKLTRQLNFGNEYIEMANGMSPLSGKENCIACSFNDTSETPLKHNDDCETNSDCRTIQPIGLSTKNVTEVKANDSSELGENGDAKPDVKKTSKNKKKKKKGKKTVSPTVSIEGFDKQNGDTHREEAPVKYSKKNGIVETKKNGVIHEDPLKQEKIAIASQLNDILKSYSKTILFDEVTSFARPYPSLPNTNKQMLMMKVALEEPGICKSNIKDGKTSVDFKNSDNYIGLVTLFILLLQGSKWELPCIITEIPFDVVSLQQCCIDDELFLIVGIAENQNTPTYRVKRTKLGSSFFHAVSHFLNNSYLDKLLRKIGEDIEGKLLQNQHIPNGSIWQQVDSWQNPLLPGSGKLSSFINVTPDVNALSRIHALPLALIPSNFCRVNAMSESISYFNTAPRNRQYACLTVGNIAVMTPKHVAGLFEMLRNECVEICGLKIAYVPNGRDMTPVLSIAIYEVDAATVDHHTLLLQANDKLKGVETSIRNKEPPLYTQTEKTPTIEYSLNTSRSYREIIKFFAPHYDDLNELRNVLNQFKVDVKNSSVKNSKRKWNDGLKTENVSLVVNSQSCCILLISASLRSSIISLILALAGKYSLQMKAFTRRVISGNQLTALGILDYQIDAIRSCQRIPNEQQDCRFNVLLFHGSNAIYKIQGLVNRVVNVINSNVTGETLNSWTKDKYFHITQKSHNIKRPSYSTRHLQMNDYFVALHVHDTSLELLQSQLNKDVISQSMDVYNAVSQINLNTWVPSCNFICFVCLGDDVINKIPDFLKKQNVDDILLTLKSAQKYFPSSDTVNYISPLELVALKYLKQVTLHQLHMLLHKDTHVASDSLSTFLEKKILLLIYKTADQKHVNDLKSDTLEYFSSLNINKDSLKVHTDDSYIAQILFHFFHPGEVHVDNVVPRIESPPLYLSESHPLFSTFSRVYNLNLIKQYGTKIDISKNENIKEGIWLYSLPIVNTLYKIIPSELSYPLQLVTGNEECYTGFSVEYDPEYTACIIKILARFQRIGFKICGLKFPVCKGTEYWMHVCLRRCNAIRVLKKMLVELESSFKVLRLEVQNSVTEVESFIRKYWKNDSRGNGGVFHCNYWAVINDLHFKKDDTFEGRKSREIEYNPNSTCLSYKYDYMKEESIPIVKGSLLSSSTVKLHEISVILFTEPLICGKYLGECLPSESTYLELWKQLDGVGYKAIGVKMTLLDEADAAELLDMLSVTDVKRKRMMKLLCDAQTPFIAIAFLGSCIITNIWMQLERHMKCEETIPAFKRHAIVPSSRKQAEYLLTSLFSQVYPNAKLDLRMQLS